jgi:putative phosphoesterase
MRVGLLADIHGNALALEGVLGAAEQAGVERLIVAGDLVGYYFAPARVLELLAPWSKWAVRGNHEDMLAQVRADRSLLLGLGERYGGGLRAVLEDLNPAQLDELAELPRTCAARIGSCSILVCHGAPWDTDEYVYPDAPIKILNRCAVPAFDVVVMGHTHYPMVRVAGKTMLVNPGSVGQPRNRRPGAWWALLDSETMEVSLNCERYDVESVASESRRRYPDLEYLSDVLQRT